MQNIIIEIIIEIAAISWLFLIATNTSHTESFQLFLKIYFCLKLEAWNSLAEKNAAGPLELYITGL